MDEKRMPIPPLAPRMPDCTLCGEETVFEEGWVCEDCKVHWPASFDLLPGSTEDFEPRPQCPAEHEPSWGKGRRYRCAREAGHDVDPKQPWQTIWHEGVRVDGDAPDPLDAYGWTEHPTG